MGAVDVTDRSVTKAISSCQRCGKIVIVSLGKISAMTRHQATQRCEALAAKVQALKSGVAEDASSSSGEEEEEEEEGDESDPSDDSMAMDANSSDDEEPCAGSPLCDACHQLGQ